MNESSRKLLAEARIAHQTGRVAQAEPAYRRLLEDEPKCADALYGLGLIEIARGGHAKAVELIAAAVEIDPAHADKLNHLGEALRESGRVDEALVHYRKALAIKPDYAQAYNNVGVAMIALGKHDEAIANFETAVRLKPDYQRGIANLAAACSQQGLYSHAADWWKALLKLTPNDATARVQLSLCYLKLNHVPEALDEAQQAVKLRPNDADAQYSVASALTKLGRLQEAYAPLEKAVALRPTDAALWSELGEACRQTTRMTQAIASFWRALSINPGLRQAHANLGLALTLTMRQQEGMQSLRKSLELFPESERAHSNLLMAMNYQAEFEAEPLMVEAWKWGERFAEPLYGTFAEPAKVKAHGKPQLKIAYISADFRQHPVATFMEPILRAHDKSRFHVTCYNDVPGTGDAVTARLKALADEWVDINGKKDDVVAKRVRDDNIDVLVDLTGHTGQHRLLVVARKPAARQLSFLGYPGTTGMAIDGKLTDAIADPVGETDVLYAEPLIRLAPCAWAYTGPAGMGEPGESPSLKNGFVTFGSFNNIAKISPETLAVWTKILQVVEKSILILKSPALIDNGTAAHVRKMVEAAGIPASRLKLFRPDKDTAEHFNSYNLVDVALDPFPYNGTTTTCEALWMGVPVVTLSGKSHVSRVGTSLLTAAGHPEWIAKDLDEYIRIASELAMDGETRAALRKEMRTTLTSSSLCDTPAFTRALEKAYEQVCGV